MCAVHLGGEAGVQEGPRSAAEGGGGTAVSLP